MGVYPQAGYKKIEFYYLVDNDKARMNVIQSHADAKNFLIKCDSRKVFHGNNIPAIVS